MSIEGVSRWVLYLYLAEVEFGRDYVATTAQLVLSSEGGILQF